MKDPCQHEQQAFDAARLQCEQARRERVERPRRKVRETMRVQLPAFDSACVRCNARAHSCWMDCDSEKVLLGNIVRLSWCSELNGMSASTHISCEQICQVSQRGQGTGWEEGEQVTGKIAAHSGMDETSNTQNMCLRRMLLLNAYG